MKSTNDKNMQSKLASLAKQALERAEELKMLLKPNSSSTLVPNEIEFFLLTFMFFI